MEPSNRRKLYPEVRRLIGARPDCRIRKHDVAIQHVAELNAPAVPIDCGIWD